MHRLKRDMFQCVASEILLGARCPNNIHAATNNVSVPGNAKLLHKKPIVHSVGAANIGYEYDLNPVSTT